MTMKFFSAGVVMSAVLALAACKSETIGSGGAGGFGGVGGVGGIGGVGGVGGVGGTAPTCAECACDYLMSEGGCKDLCDMNFNGTTNPNFCNNSNALSQCAACIAATCGATDPTQCF